MKTRILLFLLLLTVPTAAAERKYPVSGIPAAMRSAPIVMRERSVRFEVDGNTQTESVTLVMTVFARSKENDAAIHLYYDSFSSIEDVEGTLYDESGKEIRDLDEDTDIEDVSAVGSGTLSADTRMKYVHMTHHTLPYTVEYRYEVEYNGSFHWPSWTAQENEYPVLSTSFTVVMPEETPLRYWSNADSVRPLITNEDGNTVYRWSAEELRALTPEEANANPIDLSPVVRIAPDHFTTEGFKGTMTSWKEFGGWYGKLMQGRQTLSPKAQQEIAALYPSDASVREKTRILYTHLQEKTRYISIQLGIGGWQPFDAMYVHERSYGDCKALTNYMLTMLAYAGIPSYPALIKAGSRQLPMATEFPSSQFNHVILCVPNAGDTIWLECTSRAMPFGRLSDFTDDRHCLLITPEGGVVTRTPATTAMENEQRTVGSASISDIGTMEARFTMTFTGNQQSDVQDALVAVSAKDRSDWLANKVGGSKMELGTAAFSGVDDRSHEISVEFNGRTKQYASITRDRLFLVPSIVNRVTYIPSERKGRRSPVRYSYPYRDSDTLIITIPKQYTVESLPTPVDIQTPFGSFHSVTVPQGDTALVYTRSMSITATMIPLAQYDEYRSFFQRIVQSDRARAVLIRKAQ